VLKHATKSYTRPLYTILRNLITYSIILISLCAYSQSKTNSIISELTELTANSGQTIRKKSDSIKNEFIVYRLCESWAEKVEYLKTNLTDEEISELEEYKNASMHVIAVIAKLEKENTKDFALTEIDKLISGEMKLMNIGCSDAISTNSISRYLLYLLTYENPFFKPDFKLKKREIKKLEEKILIAETKFWYDM